MTAHKNPETTGQAVFKRQTEATEPADQAASVQRAGQLSVLLADDQTLVREALAALLEMEPDITVVAQAKNGEEALRLCQTTNPDIALLDIEMPHLNGIAVASALRASGSTTPIIIVTTFGRPGYLEKALAAGVNGFVVKDSPASELAEAIRLVVRGETVIDPELAVSSLTHRSPLTEREREVLAAAADGASVRQIAQRVHLSQGTVRNHLSSIIHKLGVKNRSEAVYEARESGWL